MYGSTAVPLLLYFASAQKGLPKTPLALAVALSSGRCVERGGRRGEHGERPTASANFHTIFDTALSGKVRAVKGINMNTRTVLICPHRVVRTYAAKTGLTADVYIEPFLGCTSVATASMSIACSL